MERLAVPVLLGTTVIDKFIKPVHPAERKIVLYPSPPVPILTIHEGKGKSRKNTSDIR